MFQLFIVYLMANLCAYMIMDIINKVSNFIKLKRKMKEFKESMESYDYGKSD